jgi:GTP-binding protein
VVLNKADLLAPDEQSQRVQQFLTDFGWRDKSFIISALSGAGCKELTYAIMEHLDATRESIASNEDTEADLNTSRS